MRVAANYTPVMPQLPMLTPPPHVRTTASVQGETPPPTPASINYYDQQRFGFLPPAGNDNGLGQQRQGSLQGRQHGGYQAGHLGGQQGGHLAGQQDVHRPGHQGGQGGYGGGAAGPEEQQQRYGGQGGWGGGNPQGTWPAGESPALKRPRNN